MSYARAVKQEEDVTSKAASLEVAKENYKPINGDQDYVLVEEEIVDAGADKREPLKPSSIRSPAPQLVGLEIVPPENDEFVDKRAFPSATDALPVWGDRHNTGRANSVGTDRTDYSGLTEHIVPAVSSERDEVMIKALAEANQQHEWAMEAVIRGWEAEKADLLTKLECMTEARDTLEAELKHSENNFAGMLDGMLDQKLDQMLAMLQDCGAKPFSARSPPSSSSTSVQPTVRKAQKVVQDLGAMLETMKMQQAAIEARVNNMQSAVLQLLPDPTSPKSPRPSGRQSSMLLITSGDHQSQRRRSFWEATQQSLGNSFSRIQYLVRNKVPQAANSGGQAAARMVAVPVRAVKHQAARFANHLHDRGVTNDQLKALASGAASVLATVVILKIVSGKRGQPAHERRACMRPEEDLQGHEIEVIGPDEPAEDTNVEIILNRSGVYRSLGPDGRDLVVAWPTITIPGH